MSATGNNGDRAGLAVYKIKAATGTLIKQYAINSPSLSFYLPVVAPDNIGNAAVVFAASSSNLFASIFYAQYEAATDQFDFPAVVTQGSVAYNPPQIAWGDFFDAAPDITNPNQVWLHGELAVNATTWKMRAARVQTTVAGSLKCDPTLPGETGSERKSR